MRIRVYRTDTSIADQQTVLHSEPETMKLLLRYFTGIIGSGQQPKQWLAYSSVYRGLASGTGFVVDYGECFYRVVVTFESLDELLDHWLVFDKALSEIDPDGPGDEDTADFFTSLKADLVRVRKKAGPWRYEVREWATGEPEGAKMVGKHGSCSTDGKGRYYFACAMGTVVLQQIKE